MKLEDVLRAARAEGAYVAEIKTASPDQEWMKAFLDLLGRSQGNVKVAIESAESGALLSKTTIYSHGHRNSRFRRSWDEIVRSKIDRNVRRKNGED